jgi:hypothetical protein
MLTKKEANKLRGLISRKVSRDRALWALNSDTGRGCNFEHLRAGVMADLEKADEALYGAIREQTVPDRNAEWFYVLMLDGMYVSQFGYSSAWRSAREFMNVQDARAKITDPSWHNDPDGVRRAKPVKLNLCVQIAPVKKAAA